MALLGNLFCALLVAVCLVAVYVAVRARRAAGEGMADGGATTLTAIVETDTSEVKIEAGVRLNGRALEGPGLYALWEAINSVLSGQSMISCAKSAGDTPLKLTFFPRPSANPGTVSFSARIAAVNYVDVNTGMGIAMTPEELPTERSGFKYGASLFDASRLIASGLIVRSIELS